MAKKSYGGSEAAARSRRHGSVIAPRSIPIAAPDTGQEEWQAVREPLFSGWLTQGPRVQAFENAFARRHRTQFAIASSSCTTALHLILSTLNIQAGDEVIVPAFTWISTANAVLYTGATPVFVDVNPSTYNLEPGLLSSKITPKTKAIIPVHLFGLCADLNAIQSIAKSIPIIEDAACAVGSAIGEKPAGSIGRAGAFSFHPRKIISTGEGGMITTNDQFLADKTRSLRNHGADVSEEERHHDAAPYNLPEFPWLGYNYRMTDLQGAIGLVQIGKLDRLLNERRERAEFYNRTLGEISWIQTPIAPKGYLHAWQSYVCFVKDNAPRGRDELMKMLYEKGISARPGTHAVHVQKFYREKFNLKADDYPVANACHNQTLALPLHSRMSGEDYQYVVNTLKEIG